MPLINLRLAKCTLANLQKSLHLSKTAKHYPSLESSARQHLFQWSHLTIL